MNRSPRRPTAFAKVSDKSLTAIPREVRVAGDGILLGEITEAGDDPFAVFSESTSEADDKAYGRL